MAENRISNAMGVLFGKKQIMPDASVNDGQTTETKDAPAGMAGVITKEQIKKAAAIVQDYKTYKSAAESRIKNNELYIRARQWESAEYKKKYPSEPDPTSSWLFNAMANKQADFMDNMPEPSVLPREKSDEETANVLSQILPVVLERAGFEKAYSQLGWDIQLGVAVLGTFWNSTLENGLGDIEIKNIDIMNLFWEPGITDIQDSRHVFRCELVDNEILTNMYPILKNHTGKSGLTIMEYNTDDAVPIDGKTLVYHWYYKAMSGNKRVVHYCQFVDDVVLFSSENAKDKDGNSAYPNGYYWHGEYPFTVIPMFPIKDSIVGYGTVDIGKRTQRDIDLLNKAMIQKTLLSSTPRFIYKEGSGINMDDFFDFTKPGVKVTGSSDVSQIVKELKLDAVDGNAITYHQYRINELKEVTGNRDFSQGGTSGGVTAASAIAALQEAGSKLSRAQIKNIYKAIKEVCYMCLENIRQFYTLPRQFRIIGENGVEKYIPFDNSAMMQQTGEGDFDTEGTARLPIYDIKVRVHKGNPYNKYAQNQQAMEFYSASFFNPEMATQALSALEMMDIESIDKIKQKVADNGTIYDQLQQALQMLAQITGDQRFIGGSNPPTPNNVQQASQTQSEKATEAANSSAAPK